MTPSSAIIPLFTHLIPIMFFVFMMMDVLIRNRNRIEHRLVFGIIFCCLMLFTEEFVRHYLPIEYSPVISVTWFSIAGISINGLGLHLFIKLVRLEHKMPKFLFPYFCYFPTILFVIISLLFNDQMISGNEFQQVGIWKLPIYNDIYYIAMIGSNLFNVIYIFILFIGKIKTGTLELRKIYNLLILGVSVSAFFNLVIGLIDFKGYLPPYPYIYGTLAWCLLLRHIMNRYDFLNHIDKRYEKLFNLNSVGILLIDLQGTVKEANPSAKQLFGIIQAEHFNCYSILNEDIKSRIYARKEISNCEMTINKGSQEIDVLIDGDYVQVEYEPHLILIIRDVTIQKENQKEIAYLAYHDTLTHLPNRRSFFEKLDAAIEDANRKHHKLVVVLFDIDFFKEINDQYGHQAGDQALIHVANVTKKVIATEGMVARLGGDEFIFYLNPVFTAQTVEDKIQQIQRALEEDKLMVDSTNITIQLSFGASFYPDNGLDSNALLDGADKALYQVKRNGRNHYAFLSKV